MKRLLEINLVLIKANLLFLILSLFFLAGCGAVSTSERYESSETSKDKVEIKDGELKETFDLKPYRPELNLEENEFETEIYSEKSGAWYEYDFKSESNKKIVGTEDGYRVQVIATDNLDEANRINSEVSSQIHNQRTYVNFEPPFYKVKVGDFNELSEANDMRFRLSQTGYTESKVVRETINIFE
ncbi:MAG: SPOR domain-containing protein [Ignavibacteriaceae bacterium]|nr:SPOR domain-containing protein [Ignavibacteriaceae bacterium]